MTKPDNDQRARALVDDVREGLGSRPLTLPSKYFYDARGSDLFDKITRLPEYYPTRTERAILTESAEQIARVTGASTLIELGSGTSEKTRLLLDALDRNGTLRTFVPLDVDPAVLGAAATELRVEYPSLQVQPVVGDFEQQLGRLPRQPGQLIAFLGSTIGNLEPKPRARFLQDVCSALGPGGYFLLGTDLVKDEQRLRDAYDDAAGVTADFNRNILRVLNAELRADFDPESFDHLAPWDPDNEWIEMRLRSRRVQTVRLPGADLTVELAAGEEIRTEISAKFRRSGVVEELDAAGLELVEWLTDPAEDFALSLSRRQR